ncbi:MAG: hypothetical protein ACRDRK_16850 [Pseudonocardia sp.]
MARWVRLLVRRKVRWVVGTLAVLGLVSGVALDHTHWLDELPLTGNVVAGILGAPVTVLLALVIFDRLAAAQREHDWVERRSAALRTAVQPAVRVVLSALQRCWPIAASDEFRADLDSAIDRLGALSEHPNGITEPIDERLRRAITRVGEIAAGSADQDSTVSCVQGMVPALDLAIHQADAPDLTEHAFAVHTAARAYLAAVADSGTRADSFVVLLRKLTTEPWEWTDQGGVFTWHDGNGGFLRRNALGLSSDGYTFRQLLGKADHLAACCLQLDEALRTTMGTDLTPRSPFRGGAR